MFERKDCELCNINLKEETVLKSTVGYEQSHVTGSCKLDFL
jgi:hypothetical protein